MKGIYRIIRSKDKEPIYERIKSSIQGNDSITKCTGRESLSGSTEENTQDPMKRTLKLVTGSLNDQMDASLKGTGRMASNMAKGNLRKKVEMYFGEGYGKMGIL
jgi:hypothetical protein